MALSFDSRAPKVPRFGRRHMLGVVFPPEKRERLPDELVSAARTDARITGAALTGSCAASGEDRWSDIDLALAVADEANFGQAIADWTDPIS